jgi:predicted dehydrogenase
MAEAHATNRPVGYALVGAGRFGRFCLQSYAAMEHIAPIALADADPEVARAAAEETHVPAASSIEALLARDDVDLVHIATPPITHAALAFQAIEAGKHVLCEKPLALQLDEADRLLAAAHVRGRLLAVNFIMRYNPLCEALKQIIDLRLLGEPLHGFFENYAKDEPLPPEHWFWQRDKSGGIFIEHGVHFFDLFAWWLGEGVIEAAQQIVRPGTTLFEQVNCTARYGDVLVNFYHGFTQAAQMDRQELRLHFERGTVQLFDWIPTHICVDAFVSASERDALAAVVPQAHVETTAKMQGPVRSITSRHKPHTVDGRYRITARAGLAKDALYARLLQDLLADQLAAVDDPHHRRRVDAQAGRAALALARAAQAAADNPSGRT